MTDNEKKKKKIGRPNLYTPELVEKICQRVATHPIGLHHICDMYDDMPKPETIRDWRYKYPDFSVKYLAAKSLQAMILVEDIDELLNHEIIYLVDEKGQKRIDPPSASMAIARCNNRKWQAARLAPRVYGDKSEILQRDKDEEIHKECKERMRIFDEQYRKEY